MLNIKLYVLHVLFIILCFCLKGDTSPSYLDTSHGVRRMSTPHIIVQDERMLVSSVSQSEATSIGSPPPRSSIRNNTIWILSIDGGGIRGIIPAKILAEIERLTQKPIAQLFDIMVGTSTGGIIVQALNTPKEAGSDTPKYTAAELQTMHTERGDRIFGTRYRNRFSAGGMLRPRYSAKGLQSLTRELFGQTKLSEALGNIVITGFEIERDIPMLFKSHIAKEESSHDFMMHDVAVATASAPTYFKPKRLKNMSGTMYTVIDGGVIINSPDIIGLTEAWRLFPDAVDFRVLSIGTGRPIRSATYRRMKNKGAIGWGKQLFNITISGASTLHHQLMAHVLPTEISGGLSNKRYFRLQPTITSGASEMDDISAENVRTLIYAAEDVLRKNNAEIQSLVDLILQAMFIRHTILLTQSRSTPSCHSDSAPRLIQGCASAPTLHPDDETPQEVTDT